MNDVIEFEGGFAIRTDYETLEFYKGKYEMTYCTAKLLGEVILPSNEINDWIRAMRNGANPIAEGWEDGLGNTLNIQGW